MEPGTAITPGLQHGKATRSSLACLPCRSRHLKCDGTQPNCNRCVETAKKCQYAQSRRGGLDRAALAERRKRLAAKDDKTTAAGPSSLQSPGRDTASQLFEDVEGDVPLMPNIKSVQVSPAPQVHLGSTVEDDPLIDSYYRNFHRFHPFVLPKRHLMRIHQDPSQQVDFKPLFAVMRLIGHIYASQEWSIPLKDDIDTLFSQATPTNPFMVQCRLLYSVALFWYGYQDDSKREIDTAVQTALSLQMFQREFAFNHGAQEPVLIECWRRTWWTLYIMEAYYAGTLGAMTFTISDIEATVDLPCEESEYESGNIPEPQTLQEFDIRDLAPEDTSFSSFAYLIGAVRCVALAAAVVPAAVTEEDSGQVLQAVDSIINGWLLSLPKCRKQVMNKEGEVDELMFQARMIINVAFVGLHRPLSDLKFNPMEYISSCARDPPLNTPTPELINIHTVRVLRSVESQVRLLALPIAQFRHTPFTTCMVTPVVLALLSACHFLLKETELAVARDQVRMIIGNLKALGEVWPRTTKNVREIQTIARHVLGVGCKATDAATTRSSSQVPSLSNPEDQTITSSESDTFSNNTDMFPFLSSIDGIYRWYNFDNI